MRVNPSAGPGTDRGPKTHASADQANKVTLLISLQPEIFNRISPKALLYNRPEIGYAGAWFYGGKGQYGNYFQTRHLIPGIV